MSEHQLAVIGTAIVYIAVFGFASFLVYWTLECWWRVYKAVVGIKLINKALRIGYAQIRADCERKPEDGV